MCASQVGSCILEMTHANNTQTCHKNIRQTHVSLMANVLALKLPTGKSEHNYANAYRLDR